MAQHILARTKVFPHPRFRSWISRSLIAFCCALLVACEVDPELDAIESLHEGWEYFEMGDMDLALSRFESARAQTQPGQREHSEALYGIANVWDFRQPIEDKQWPLARELYTQVIQAASESDWAAWSSLNMARMLHYKPVGEPVDYEAVRQAYREVYERYPHHDAGHEALLCANMTFFFSADEALRREGCQGIKAFLDRHPESNYRNLASVLLALGYELTRQPQPAQQAWLLALEEIDIDPLAYTDRIYFYWQVATLAHFELGEFELARQYYQHQPALAMDQVSESVT